MIWQVVVLCLMRSISCVSCVDFDVCMLAWQWHVVPKRTKYKVYLLNFPFFLFWLKSFIYPFTYHLLMYFFTAIFMQVWRYLVRLPAMGSPLSFK